MKYFDWNKDKNELLKQEREVCFEDFESAIDDGRVLDVIEHPNKTKYANQMIFVFVKEDYVYLVPFVEDDEKIFLKTIFASAKMTKKYLFKGGKK